MAESKTTSTPNTTKSTGEVLSPAQAYRKQKQEETRPEFTITNPETGATFLVRLPNLSKMIRAGILPLHLIGIMEQAKNKGADAESTFEQLPVKEKIRAIQFSTSLVTDILLAPKIVDVIEDPDMEITPDELDERDFNFLLSWGMSGGDKQANPGLHSFRDEPGSTSVDSVNGQK